MDGSKLYEQLNTAAQALYLASLDFFENKLPSYNVVKIIDEKWKSQDFLQLWDIVGKDRPFLIAALTLIGTIMIVVVVSYRKKRIPEDERLQINLASCYEELREEINATNFNPLLLRLAVSKFMK